MKLSPYEIPCAHCRGHLINRTGYVEYATGYLADSLGTLVRPPVSHLNSAADPSVSNAPSGVDSEGRDAKGYCITCNTSSCPYPLDVIPVLPTRPKAIGSQGDGSDNITALDKAAYSAESYHRVGIPPGWMLRDGKVATKSNVSYRTPVWDGSSHAMPNSHDINPYVILPLPLLSVIGTCYRSA